MNESERFYRNLDKMAGRYKNAGLNVSVESVREAFTQAMGKVPDELRESIFLRFLDAFNRSGKEESDFIEFSYSLGAYIDLFWMDYSDGDHPLSDDDWTFLRDETSASAGDLDLDILTYVMQQIMAHGKI